MGNKAEAVILWAPQAKVEPDEPATPVGAWPWLETSLEEPSVALEKRAVLTASASPR